MIGGLNYLRDNRIKSNDEVLNHCCQGTIMNIIGSKCGRNAYGVVKSLFLQRGVMPDIMILNSAGREG